MYAAKKITTCGWFVGVDLRNQRLVDLRPHVGLAGCQAYAICLSTYWTSGGRDHWSDTSLIFVCKTILHYSVCVTYIITVHVCWHHYIVDFHIKSSFCILKLTNHRVKQGYEITLTSNKSNHQSTKKIENTWVSSNLNCLNYVCYWIYRIRFVPSKKHVHHDREIEKIPVPKCKPFQKMSRTEKGGGLKTS